jgi:dienelactone hydrolase
VLRFLFIFFFLSSYSFAETINYTSYNPSNFEEIFSGKFKSKSVELSGKLTLPNGEGKYPVVILQHGTGDNKKLKKWYSNLTKSLLNNGIGVFINDSYKNRKIKGPELTLAPRVIDGIYALQAVANHPRVDSTRIGIQGYSYGGMVAFYTAYQGLADLVNAEYAAHMPVYPGCDVVINHMKVTQAKIKMIIAQKDDYAPAKDCIQYGPQIGDIKIYEGAHHGFVFAKKKKEYLKDTGHFNKCKRGYIQPDGKWFYNGKVRKGTEKKIFSSIWKECGAKGVHIGGTDAYREMLINDTVEFFGKNL